MSGAKPEPIPQLLQPFREDIECSLKSTVLLLPYKKHTTVTESKFAGTAYLPKYFAYPKDLAGKKMKLLAQINFDEFPPLQDFPQKGLLQFFISTSILEAPAAHHESIFQHFFKVRFIANPDVTQVTDDAFTSNDFDENFPIEEELALTYRHIKEPVSALDYRLAQYYGQYLAFFQPRINDSEDIHEIYTQHYLGAGHKMGGYPYFIEEDVRSNSALLKRYDSLLIQIDSNDDDGIMWGDSGVGHFFINREKLLQQDFSDILFHWEQY